MKNFMPTALITNEMYHLKNTDYKKSHEEKQIVQIGLYPLNTLNQ